MTRTEVRALIKSAVDALTQTIQFNSGRITEFNSERSNQYPFIWLEPLAVGTELNTNQVPIDEWACILHVANKDAAGSTPEQYEAIVDQCDLIAQKFIHKLNAVVTGYKLLTLTSISREPFIHKHADDVSGVMVSFTITVIDNTNVC